MSEKTSKTTDADQPPHPLHRDNRGSGCDDPAVDQLYSHGRLVQFPAQKPRNKELVQKLLAHIARTSFEPGAVYNEQDVNARLMAVFDDYTALRRYLISDGYLTRDPAGREYRLA